METTTPPHTPGPWVAEIFPSLAEARLEGLFGWASIDVFNGPVGCVWRQTEPNVNTGLPGSIETSAANAHLIAAAPDLLTTLERIVERYEREQSILLHDIGLAKIAIAKAKGAPTE